MIPRPVYLISIFVLLLLPAFAAAVSFKFGNDTSGMAVYFKRETLWLSFGALFVGAAFWQARISRLAFPALPRTDFLLLAALVILSIALSQFVSLSPKYALNRLWVLLLVLLVGYASFLLSTVLKDKFSQSIYKVLIGGVLLHIPFIFLLIYLRQDAENFPWTLSIPGWRGLRPYNYFVEVGVAVGVGFLVINGGKSKRSGTILFVAVSICWAMLIWGGGRGAIVGLLGAFAVASVAVPSSAIKLWKSAAITFAWGAVLSLLIWTPNARSFGLFGMLIRSSANDINAVSAGRFQMWVNGTESIKEAPIFGYGLGQFIYLQAPRVPAAANSHLHIHNIVLEVVLSWGAVGAALFTTLFIRTYINALNQVRRIAGGERLPAFLALTALLGHGLFSGTYFHTHSLIYMAIFFGICLAPNPAQNENTNG